MVGFRIEGMAGKLTIHVEADSLTRIEVIVRIK